MTQRSHGCGRSGRCDGDRFGKLPRMEISLVRKRVRDSIEQAQKAAAARRAANQEAAHGLGAAASHTAIPPLQQVSQVLKSEGYGFRVFTPAGIARLTSERSADDYIEVAMDTAGPVPVVARPGEPHARPRAVQRRAHPGLGRRHSGTERRAACSIFSPACSVRSSSGSLATVEAWPRAGPRATGRRRVDAGGQRRTIRRSAVCGFDQRSTVRTARPWRLAS